MEEGGGEGLEPREGGGRQGGGPAGKKADMDMYAAVLSKAVDQGKRVAPGAAAPAG